MFLAMIIWEKHVFNLAQINTSSQKNEIQGAQLT